MPEVEVFPFPTFQNLRLFYNAFSSTYAKGCQIIPCNFTVRPESSYSNIQQQLCISNRETISKGTTKKELKINKKYIQSKDRIKVIIRSMVLWTVNPPEQEYKLDFFEVSRKRSTKGKSGISGHILISWTHHDQN